MYLRNGAGPSSLIITLLVTQWEISPPRCRRQLAYLETKCLRISTYARRLQGLEQVGRQFLRNMVSLFVPCATIGQESERCSASFRIFCNQVGDTLAGRKEARLLRGLTSPTSSALNIIPPPPIPSTLQLDHLPLPLFQFSLHESFNRRAYCSQHDQDQHDYNQQQEAY